MRIVRGVVLAIIATLMLLGANAGIASANPGSGIATDDAGFSATSDPGDPGFPPDD